MTIEVRALPADFERRRWGEVVFAAFGEELHEEEFAIFEQLPVGDRLFGAWDGDALVGGGGVFPFRLTIPGGEVPAAGVTAVGVIPTHRRRGILTQLMRRQLDDARQRAEPVAILWASEGSIYQRFGYGLASLAGSIEVERARTAYRVPVEREGRLRLISRDEASRLFPAVYDRVRVQRPGFFARPEPWWELEILADPESRRHGAGPKYYAVHEVDGKTEAYVMYRIHHEWDAAGSKSRLQVIELIAGTTRALRETWRFVFDVDLVHTITAPRLEPDHPLLLLLAEPRRLGFRLGDALWLRIVDLPAALGARSYRGHGSLVLQIADGFCPWNDGRWKLEADEDGVRVERTDVRADLLADITDLAAVYLGGFTFGQLAAAGRVVECSAAGLKRADDLFRTDVAPWCPQVF